MKIGYIQTSPTFGDKEANFDQALMLVGGEKADLIVLPELFATGYTFTSEKEARNLAEGLEGPTSQFCQGLSRKTGAVIVAGFIEQDDDAIYNSSLIVRGGEVLGTYRKIHLYFKEKRWFSPGNEPFKVFETNDMKIGVMICFDWIFPEAMRTLALKGADVIAHPANLVLPFCQKASVTRCLENRVFSITANRIGAEKRGEDEFKFTGQSQITSYDGEVLSSAPEDEMHLDFVDVDITQSRDKSLNDLNDLFEDRRPEYYL